MTAAPSVTRSEEDHQFDANWSKAVAAGRDRLEELRESYESAREAIATAENVLADRMRAIKNTYSGKYLDVAWNEAPGVVQHQLRQLSGNLLCGYVDLSGTKRPRLALQDEAYFEKFEQQNALERDATVLVNAADELIKVTQELEHVRRARSQQINTFLEAKQCLIDLRAERESPEALDSDIAKVDSDLKRLKRSSANNLREVEDLQKDLDSLQVAELRVDLDMAETPEAQKAASEALDKEFNQRAKLQRLLQEAKEAQKAFQRRIATTDERLAELREERGRLYAAVHRYQIAVEEETLSKLLSAQVANSVRKINELRMKVNQVTDSDRFCERAMEIKLNISCPGGLRGLERISIS